MRDKKSGFASIGYRYRLYYIFFSFNGNGKIYPRVLVFDVASFNIVYTEIFRKKCIAYIYVIIKFK